MLLNFLYSVAKLEGKKKGASSALRSPLIEVVFDSDIDRFRPVVVNELGEVGFSDSESGRVTHTREFLGDFAGFHFRDSAHTVEGVPIGLTVEGFTEDIELFCSGFENDGDIVEVSPASDAVFEGILVEPEAFDFMVSAIRIEEVIVIGDTTDRGAVGGMNGISERDFRSESSTA